MNIVALISLASFMSFRRAKRFTLSLLWVDVHEHCGFNQFRLGALYWGISFHDNANVVSLLIIAVIVFFAG